MTPNDGIIKHIVTCRPPGPAIHRPATLSRVPQPHALITGGFHNALRRDPSHRANSCHVECVSRAAVALRPMLRLRWCNVLDVRCCAVDLASHRCLGVCFGQSFVFLPLSVLRFLSQRIQLSLISSSIYHRFTDPELEWPVSSRFFVSGSFAPQGTRAGPSKVIWGQHLCGLPLTS